METDTGIPGRTCAVKTPYLIPIRVFFPSWFCCCRCCCCCCCCFCCCCQCLTTCFYDNQYQAAVVANAGVEAVKIVQALLVAKNHTRIPAQTSLPVRMRGTLITETYAHNHKLIYRTSLQFPLLAAIIKRRRLRKKEILFGWSFWVELLCWQRMLFWNLHSNIRRPMLLLGSHCNSCPWW